MQENNIKSSNKLILPVLAISLISGSAWALNAPRVIPQPFLGNLLALSICHAAAGIASCIAVEGFFSDNLPTNTIAKRAVQIGLAGYWIKAQVKAMNQYNAQINAWRAQHRINQI